MVAQYHFSQMWNLIPDLKVRVTKLLCNNRIFVNVTTSCLLKLGNIYRQKHVMVYPPLKAI